MNAIRLTIRRTWGTRTYARVTYVFPLPGTDVYRLADELRSSYAGGASNVDVRPVTYPAPVNDK